MAAKLPPVWPLRLAPPPLEQHRDVRHQDVICPQQKTSIMHAAAPHPAARHFQEVEKLDVDKPPSIVDINQTAMRKEAAACPTGTHDTKAENPAAVPSIWTSASLEGLPAGADEQKLSKADWRVPAVSRHIESTPPEKSTQRLRGPVSGPLDVPTSWQGRKQQDVQELESLYANALERCQLERRDAETAQQEAERRLAAEREVQEAERKAWADERRTLLQAFEKQIGAQAERPNALGAFGQPDQAFKWCCERLQRQELRQHSLEAKLQYERQVRARENAVLLRLLKEAAGLSDSTESPSSSSDGSLSKSEDVPDAWALQLSARSGGA